METRREQLEKRIRYQDKVETSVVPTKHRVTTNMTRSALIKLIVRSGREMMELFMTERPIRNKCCFQALIEYLQYSAGLIVATTVDSHKM